MTENFPGKDLRRILSYLLVLRNAAAIHPLFFPIERINLSVWFRRIETNIEINKRDRVVLFFSNKNTQYWNGREE